MSPKPENPDSERLARLAREWFADARHREAEAIASEPSRKRSDGGDGGSSGSGGLFDWGGGDSGGGDGGD